MKIKKIILSVLVFFLALGFIGCDKKTPEEEKQELLVKIKNGDNEAREKFIQGNLRLVLSVIQRFTRTWRKHG